MSDIQNEQAAVDATQAPAVPGVAVGQDAQGGGDELEALLRQYETETAPKPEPITTQPEQNAAAATTTQRPDPAIAEVQRYIFKQDMDKTVVSVRGDLPAEQFDDTIVRAWINARADEDPRLAQAWVNRHTNPKQFDKVVAGLGREFAKKYGKLPDKQATDDREAVTAAVRGASTRAPEGQAPDYSSMSDAQFEAEKREMFKKR